MPLSKDTKTAWPRLDPYLLERIVPETEGFIALDDLRAASQTVAPGLEEAFCIWGQGVTVSEAGIPLRDWRAFLQALRREMQSIESKAGGGN